ncbi:MAG: bifunctional DNA-formamidopyrimidine glycosylase/DNA-(apurinic or apyrimidinic site) lyase [Proteobacteria bacterium]|nr:bifunctional DNA-formamidopyrimidine glycosylase/DNA-(apurinic or apyrimidinic site) lyase [Pseudomonadota bacterium]MCL2309512.1 bifunctional DNA-formamidopyrimidine glycosylase/DNA-(apurinic or apyrimidinic site) lyase [Pseudomonadota bacterium]
MPELPEVEVTVRSLRSAIKGHCIEAFRCFNHRLRQPVPAGLGKTLVGRYVTDVRRRAKYLLLDCNERNSARDNTGNGKLGGTLILHLGMSGSLRVFPLGVIPPRRQHDHLEFLFDHGIFVRYHDPRRFGLCVWVPADAETPSLLAKLGPEPLENAFHAKSLRQVLQGRTTSIKNALMDAHVVVGVGNIYASEALFRAGIRPTTPAGSLGFVRLARLVEAVRATLEDAIAAGGSSLRDYAKTDGSDGWFQNDCFVYGRAGEPCRRCSAPIQQLRQSGRTTFYCKRCQR